MPPGEKTGQARRIWSFLPSTTCPTWSTIRLIVSFQCLAAVMVFRRTRVRHWYKVCPIYRMSRDGTGFFPFNTPFFPRAGTPARPGCPLTTRKALGIDAEDQVLDAAQFPQGHHAENDPWLPGIAPTPSSRVTPGAGDSRMAWADFLELL